jgi:phosphatidylethanolamine/phosphatidyl-N-methylethanolamine N-methyltransferase
MSKPTAAFYNRFSLLYPLVDVFLQPQKRLMFQEINNLPDGNLLEIGVGNGAHLQWYKKHAVTGIDTSAAMLEIARKNEPENVSLMEMSGEVLLFADQVFDYVVLCHVIAVVDDPERLLKEVHRVLKPQGQVIILNHFTPANWPRHMDHAFEPIAKILHFRSVFYLKDLHSIGKFTLQKEINAGMGSYFKLLIYRKR